jgi:6,7-dimethyl-8-ribityllumazine synthase
MPLNLLFAISDFYPEYSKELVLNAITFLHTNNQSVETFTHHYVASDCQEILRMIMENSFHKTSFQSVDKKEINLTAIKIKGSLELPQVISFALEKQKYDGIIVFGVIKQGRTSHDYVVTTECHRGLTKLALKHQIPITTAIINSGDDAVIKERTSESGYNVGKQAVETCLQLIEIKNKL